MDTRDFGAFLSRMRKSQGLTQAGLAEQLHVTDKAVSRWERGIGLPDINTLEPLADALGLSLSDLMHCHDPEQDRETTAAPLEDFFSMLRRETIDWHSVRTTLLWLSIALALWGIFTHPGTVAVHWHGTGNGDFCADGWMASYLIFPLCAAMEFFALQLWQLFEQTGYFRHWGETGAVITDSLHYLSPGVRFVKLALDLFFFFCCGFVVPFCELVMIAFN